MAMCEKCGSSGFDMREMRVGEDKKTFIGPCCLKADPSRATQDVEYGIELSSHLGLKAYVRYGGLSLEFKRTIEELKSWSSPVTLPEPEIQQPPQPTDAPPPPTTPSKEMPN